HSYPSTSPTSILMFQSCPTPPALPSFPTRRSSDLIMSYVDQIATLDVTGVEPMAHALPLHNVLRDDMVEAALPIEAVLKNAPDIDRKSTRLNSSHLVISYAVFCLKKKNRGEHLPAA